MSVVVVGSVNMDVVARVPHIPAPGETLLATDTSRGGGGKGANQAVAAARAGGARTAFVGAVGDDGDGAALRAALAQDGIDLDGLVTVDAPTGAALISVADDGENAIVVIPGANGAFFDLDPAQRSLVGSADVVLAQLEIPVATVRIAAAARREGAVVVLNAAPSGALADESSAAALLPEIDVLVVNEHELLEVAGLDEREAAIAALASRVPVLVVTLGAHGSVVVVDGARETVAAFRAEPVDTTGAGDTFCGVFAARLAARPRADRLDIRTIVDAARAGSAAAALTVGRAGAQAAVPTSLEVDALLEGSR